MTITDPRTNVTSVALTAATGGLVSSITYPQSAPNTQTYARDPAATGSGDFGVVTDTDPNSHATTYESVYGGQVVKVTDALGHSRKATYNADADLTTAVDAIGAGNTTTFGYDALNNPFSVAIPTGASVNAQYASGSGCSSSDSSHPYLVKCVEDAQGNQTTFTYDGPGNRLSQKNVTTGVTLSYTYNGPSPTCGGKPGQLCTSKDGDGNTTSYHYDTAGNLTSITPPVPRRPISQTFDALGRVTTVTDGRGDKTTYSYDGDDRITQVLLDGATTCTYSAGTCVGFGYDANGNRISMQDVTGLTQYGFDAMNRQTTKTLPSSATLTLGYDPAGNVASYTDAGGTVDYGYNAANQLTSLAEPGGSCSGTVSLCTTFGVNNNGQRTTTTYPSGTVMNVTLDASGRPTEVKTFNGASMLADFAYAYTNAGADTELVQSRTDQVTGRVTSYGYDAANELTKATETSGSSITAQWLYCYDNAGNRTHASTATASTASCTTSPTTSYGYNGANELTSLNGSSSGWSYDGNGNETAAGSIIARTGETYTGSDQLASGTAGGTGFSAGYAGLSNDERVSTTSGASSNTFQYGEEGLASQSCSCTATYWTRDPSGTLVSERSGSSHDYYAFDGLGSVVALVDASGSAVDTYSYDPYGNTRASTGTTFNPMQYIAGYNDGTGLYHYGARYYDPTLGRFTQQDPANQAPNQYAYGNNDPTNGLDPNGRCVLGIFGSNCGNVACHVGAGLIIGGAFIALSGGFLLAGGGAIFGELVLGATESVSQVGIGSVLFGAGTTILGTVAAGLGC